MKHILLFLGSFLLLSAQLYAATPATQPVGLRHVVAALESPFSANASQNEIITDFQADFFQESQIASLDRSQQGDGRVTMKFVKNPGNRVPKVLFRWEYERPTRQEFVSNGLKLWVHLPENRQVILSDVEQTGMARQNDPMTFLTGLGNLSRDFDIYWAEPNRDIDGNFVLELTPRRPSSLFTRMLVVVDRDAAVARAGGAPDNSIFPILSTTVYDPYDNVTIIDFNNTKTNQEVFPVSFDFIVPPNVDVVYPTGQSMGF